MYAKRRLYLPSREEDSEDDGTRVHVTRDGRLVKALDPRRITLVEEELMYWRKANHIHAWFVDNVQDGQDDCGSYPVPQKKLQELLDICNRVIEGSELVDGTTHGGTYYSKENPAGVAQQIPCKVIKDDSVARKWLPTKDGFFFGMKEYNEYYLEDVIQTRDWLVETLSPDKLVDGAPCGSIIYSSSW